jgi:hypothetical protein
MKQPVKIRYEQQSGKGANMFVGMIYFDDGSKERIADSHKKIAGLDLPIEHDGLPKRTEAALVQFPRIPTRAKPPSPPPSPRRSAPLWPLMPQKR